MRGHRFLNLVHSTLLIAGMMVLCGLLSWFFFGPGTVVGIAAIVGALLLFGPRMSPHLVFRLYRGQRLDRRQAPRLIEIAETLSRRAELPNVPSVYYIPSRMVNAFAAGTPDSAGIGVTDGILRTLSLRELAGVLAHELSHLRNNDLIVMGLADHVTRLTHLLSLAGQLLLLINLPALLLQQIVVPWGFVILLIFAPTISALMQLALSRQREFDADVGAVELTGDPRGLASALQKMEQIQGRLFERIFLPGRRVPEPSLLRTHPQTEERIRRLLALDERRPADEWLEGQGPIDREAYSARRPTRPGWHVSGLWH